MITYLWRSWKGVSINNSLFCCNRKQADYQLHFNLFKLLTIFWWRLHPLSLLLPLVRRHLRRHGWQSHHRSSQQLDTGVVVGCVLGFLFFLLNLEIINNFRTTTKPDFVAKDEAMNENNVNNSNNPPNVAEVINDSADNNPSSYSPPCTQIHPTYYETQHHNNTHH